MNSSNEVLARAEAALERARLRDMHRASGSAVRRAVRIARWSAGGVVAVLLAAIVWGLAIAPLGVTGVMVTALLAMGVVLLAILLSAETPVKVESLKQTDLKALPGQTARWLDTQRPALPAPARTLADGIGVKLQALAPQLAMLDEREPAAAEIRRLVGEELPELVRGYERVPPSLRKAGVDGMAPDTQLIEGLAVVDSELARMSEQLARGDLHKLATQGKYLELKYQGDGIN